MPLPRAFVAFVELWKRSPSAVAVAHRLGISRKAASVRASYLRREYGVSLDHKAPGRPKAKRAHVRGPSM